MNHLEWGMIETVLATLALENFHSPLLGTLTAIGLYGCACVHFGHELAPLWAWLRRRA